MIRKSRRIREMAKEEVLVVALVWEMEVAWMEIRVKTCRDKHDRPHH